MDELGIINYLDTEIEDDTLQPDFNETHHPIVDIYKNYEELKKTNITKPILTRYEKTKIIGLRAEMIARGAKPRVTVPPNVTNTLRIAELEFEKKKIPFIIRRKTNNAFEYWKLDDLVIR